MVRNALVSITLLTLSACGSSPTVEENETYRGRHTAAIAPVADSRAGYAVGGSGAAAQVQRAMRQNLDRAGIFAGVVTLDRRDEGNEAEVIIEPTLVSAGARPALKVRVIEKSSHRTVLNALYKGRGGDPIQAAIEDLEQDLEDKYRYRTRDL